MINAGFLKTLLIVVMMMGVYKLSTAEMLPPAGSLDARVRVVEYHSEEVYRLYAFVGYAIELVFEDGEVLTGQGGGDLEGIVLGSHDNHLILKPKAANVGTNLVVYTNRRAYRFEYSVSPRQPNRELDEVMYAVRFVYPPLAVSANGLTAAQQTELDLSRASATRFQHIDYWYCGSPALKPVAASDDGVHTRLRFANNAELPAIFVRNDDGSESLLNFNINEGEVLIHRIAPRFILRRGKLSGCVVNKDFSGSGERLESGTVSPQVQRQRKDTP